MPLQPGVRIGAYEIVDLLGEGGMGTVYRARDTRLDREVAIKVIRAGIAHDPVTRARFTREARLLASLSHPHVAAIFDVDECDGVPFLVLELVPGSTLAERLSQGRLSTREALAFASQIAAAVEAAHERGVIHRDLKPSNIKITPEQSVKVLDFGLAKALTGDSGDRLAQAPTLTAGGTADGVVLGTASYMSPEQARGRKVDKQTDVWAFGCILYDMFAGRSAFASETISDTLAAILTRDPDWSLLSADTPASIQRLLERCLQKEVHDRLHDMGDVRLLIEDTLRAGSGAVSGITAGGPPGRLRWRDSRTSRVAVGGILVGALLTAVAAWSVMSGRQSSVRPPVRFVVPLQTSERLGALDFPLLAMSPTDAHIAYVATRGGPPQLFIRPIASFDATMVAGTEGALTPFFSPDGQWIGFFAGGKLKKVPLSGGPVRTLADAPIGFGATWGPDNRIVYAPNNGSALWAVSADGGEPVRITTLDTARGEFSHRWPEFVPDGTAVLFTVGTSGSWDDADIVLQSIGSGERRTLVQGGTNPHYVEPGRLLYARGGRILSVAFDLRTRQITGDTVPAVDAIPESVDGAAQFATSRTASAVYVPAGPGESDRRLVWIDRDGQAEPLAAPPRAYSQPRLSPDGRAIVVTIADQIWRYDISQNALTQLTFEGGSDPIWAGDGSRIVYAATRGGASALFSRPADGSGGERRLPSGPGSHEPGSSSPDGQTLAFVEYDPSRGRDISLLRAGQDAPQPLLATPANEMAPAFSPDGRWLAYVSDQSGVKEVYVVPSTGGRRGVQVSQSGGTEPVWARDGHQLFYRVQNRMMAVGMTSQDGIKAGPPHPLFAGTFDEGSASRPAYDVSTDGRFLMVRSPAAGQPTRELRVILSPLTSR
jgi:eukaryotic-like serine/threonine-protein kinase